MESFDKFYKSELNTEIKQYFMRGNIPTKNEYIEICSGKTGVLFATILKACSILLNIDMNAAYNLGMLYGICFQINNDLNNKSEIEDKKNDLYTARAILGIEKTQALLDNYKKEMCDLVDELPNNDYKKCLEDLINKL